VKQLPGIMARPINDRLLARTDRDVTRGREAFLRIGDALYDRIAKGHQILSVTVNKRTADAMIAHYQSFSQFDGVLPSHCFGRFQQGGVPLIIDFSADSDFTIRSRPKAN
jgi:hypothetical protein